jgi:hypothetical protein
MLKMCVFPCEVGEFSSVQLHPVGLRRRGSRSSEPETGTRVFFTNDHRHIQYVRPKRSNLVDRRVSEGKVGTRSKRVLVMSKKRLVTEEESNDSAPTLNTELQNFNINSSVTVHLLRQHFGVVL